MNIRISLVSIPVQDQKHALEFYTQKIGFEVARELPQGEQLWLSVFSPAGANGVELSLEPTVHPAAKTYQEALYAGGLPVITLLVTDLDEEHERLAAAGVQFKTPPTEVDGVSTAVFDDTCGNFVRLAQD